MIKPSIKLDSLTASPDTDSPVLLTMNVVPEREQLRLLAEQVELLRVVTSEGRAILRDVREPLRLLSRVKGAVTVRVMLEG